MHPIQKKNQTTNTIPKSSQSAAAQASSELVFFDSVQQIAAWLDLQKNVFTVTDQNVLRLYPQLIGEKRYILAPGEDAKTLASVEEICRAMLQQGCDRNTVVLAVGGGVVGDTAGFAASVFMRGVPWFSVPTTLLAQVDSGIGGKTAVDLDGYKNVIGAFHMPPKIMICTALLASLNAREWMCGVGEAVKTAFLDQQVFTTLSSALDALSAREQTGVRAVVEACARFKHRVTTEDFTERGLRKILNVGHTVGHAIETADKHRLSHGEYVLWGMLAETYLFREQMDASFYRTVLQYVRGVLGVSALPIFDAQRVADAARADKKNRDGKISVLVPVRVGDVRAFWLDASVLGKRLGDWQKAIQCGEQV